MANPFSDATYLKPCAANGQGKSLVTSRPSQEQLAILFVTCLESTAPARLLADAS
jgi:hypothetical protein